MMFHTQRAAQRGIVMIDAIVYIAVLGIVLIIAGAVFDKGMRESAGLQRNINDIERALKAGERWRADVRSAAGAIQVGPQTLTIPQTNGVIVYAIETNQVHRIVSNRSEVFLAD